MATRLINQEQLNEIINNEENAINAGIRSREGFDRQYEKGYVRISDSRRTLDEFRKENHDGKLCLAQRDDTQFGGNVVSGVACGMNFVRFAGYLDADVCTKEGIRDNYANYSVNSVVDLNHPVTDARTGEVKYRVYDQLDLSTSRVELGDEI